MTREKWAKLTPKQKIIKVAELCGWKVEPTPFPEHERFKFWLVAPNGVHCPSASPSVDECWDWWQVSGVPDYLQNLNAMHEVENVQVNFSNILNYHCNLLEIIIRDKDHDPNRKWPMSICIGAKAAQRAEAFVLTMEPENAA